VPKTNQPKHILAIASTLFAGIFIAVQSRVNGGLGLALQDGVGAALYSFTSGWILLGLSLVLMPKARAGLRRIPRLLAARELPIWMILGGAFGGYLVMTQGLVAGTLGISLFTVSVVAGQGISAIVIDSNGLFGVEKRKLNPSRILGAIIVVLGVAMVLGEPETKTILLVLLPLSAGLGLGFQQAANGKVRITAESAIAATFVNFAVGTLLILIVKIVSLPSVGLSSTYPSNWYLYIGGFVGVIFIAIQVITVSRIGVLGLGVLLGTGQLLGSLAIDLLFPVAGNQIGVLEIAGVAAALVGALLVNLKR
jgi:bacterial/archaeal transporter family-2 protein